MTTIYISILLDQQKAQRMNADTVTQSSHLSAGEPQVHSYMSSNLGNDHSRRGGAIN
jgi:hypothetical protein